MKHILITGGAGFIGSNLINSLIKDPQTTITSLDNFDPFYSSKIKRNNIKKHLKKSNFITINADIRNLGELKKKLCTRYDVIVHLAAKVGVKPSILDPLSYTQVNINGTQNMLEMAKILKCKQFIFASSSSVYGINKNFPWREKDNVLLPISPYASTKKSGELLGHVYSYLFHFRFIALRFFTVYGPGQRPDLVIHKFANLISKGKAIDMYGTGKTKRDYTYVDDIVSGIISALSYSASFYEIINLGNNKPIELRELITLLESFLKKKAIINRLPQQQGDVPMTFADITKAKKLLGYKPKTDIVTGLRNFISWFRLQNQ